MSDVFINEVRTGRGRATIEVSTVSSTTKIMKEVDPCYICELPYNNRLMVCCGMCLNWFHGDCMEITRAQCKEMEEIDQNWQCPGCIVISKDTKTPDQTNATECGESSMAEIGNHMKGENVTRAQSLTESLRRDLSLRERSATSLANSKYRKPICYSPTR